MSPPADDPLAEHYGRCPAIAAEWYEAIAATSYAAYSPAEIRGRLTELAEQAMACLFADEFAPEPAYQIGAALVDLHYTAPPVIGRTVTILARRLVEALPAAEIAARQEHLAALLGAVATGFEATIRAQVLKEQSDVQQAALKLQERLLKDLRQQKAQLAESNVQLQEEIKARKAIEAELRQSEARYRILFENSPVALWEVDFSPVADYFASLRERGITDPLAYLAADSERLRHCFQLARVVDVNKATVALYKAKDKEALLGRPAAILVRSIEPQNLLTYATKLFSGEPTFGQETTGFTLTGDEIDIFIRWVLPSDHPAGFAQVIIAIIDITQRKQAEEALQRSAQQLQALRELDLKILAAHSAKAIAHSAIELVQQLLPGNEFSIFRVDREARHAAYIITVPDHLQQTGPISIQAQPLIEALQRGETLYIPDLRALPEPSDALQASIERGNRTVLVVPLIAQGILLGGLGLNSLEVDAFDKTHIETAKDLALPIALALQNAQLLATEQQARHQADTLRAIAKRLNSSLDLAKLLELILQAIERVLPFDSASIILLQESGADFVAHRGLSDDQVAAVRQWVGSLSAITRVLSRREPVIIPDVHQDALWQPIAGIDHIRCWMGVPLIVKGQVLGVLTLDSRTVESYSNGDAQLALAVANQAAVAIDNAQLYERAQRHANELEQLVKERTRELKALYDVTAVTSEHLELHVILDQALNRVIAALAAEAGTIHLFEESAQQAPRLLHHQGLDAERAARLHEAEPEATLIAEVASRNEIKLEETAVALDGAFSYLGAPMRARGQLLGVLSLLSAPQQAQRYTAEDLALLGSFADHIAVAIENDRLRRKAQQIAILEERERLARDLHDSITQLLYSLTLRTEVIRELAHSDQIALLHETTEKMDLIANQALMEMRLLLYQLRTADFEPRDFLGALENRLNAVETRTQLQVSLSAPDALTLPEGVAVELLPVAQEALNNILKHARAGSVVIRIDSGASYVTMDIIDDGRGFDLHAARDSGGMGLINMQARVTALNGDLEINTQPGRGTSVRVHIPLGG